MATGDDVEAMVNDPEYVGVTRDIARSIDVPFDEAAPFYAEFCREALSASGCTREQLLACLRDDRDALVSFTVAKWQILEGSADEQEYSAGEEPDRHDRDDLIEVMPLDRAFLIGHLCEFALLKDGQPSDLAAYVKRMRIPGQKAYVATLRRALATATG